MKKLDAIKERVQDNVRKEILQEVSNALVFCKQPFGCDHNCPFSQEAAKFDHPFAYCMPIMASRLDYVRVTLWGDEAWG